MQVVILAGGLGTRLGEVTRTLPKPMAPVRGVPYLEHQLRLLAGQCLTDVVLLTGYLGEQIEEHFGDGGRMGLRIRYSREPRPLGTGGALRHAQPMLAEAFLLLYGDSYLRIDYTEVAALLERSAAVMAVHHDPFGETNVRPNVGIDWNGVVLRYDKSAAGAPGLEYIEAGVLALRRSVLDLIPPAGAVSLEEQIFPVLIERRQLVAFPTAQRFYDIGTPERLQAIERYLA